jgi:hypothetical protein
MAIQHVKDFYQRNERWIPAAFFVGGFAFDAIMLRRIDEPVTIIQQAIYLVISALFVGVEVIETIREVPPPRFLARVWKYREAFLDFLLGTLLNSYTIFYFKSASALTSFIFIVILVSLLLINEFNKSNKYRAQFHMALLSLCLISYFVSLAPILLGYVGTIPFLCATTASTLIFMFYYSRLKPRLVQTDAQVAAHVEEVRKTHMLRPFAIMQGLFVVLYFTHAIPPVPLSVSYMGIYHDVTKSEGEYQLVSTRSRWRFWESGDETFRARPGDTIYCFFRVFSPSRFKTELQVRWLFKVRSGWVPQDAIPIATVGGREEGFRGITKKTNYQPGEWRVQIETSDSREVGRITFEVVADDSTDPRTNHITVQ